MADYELPSGGLARKYRKFFFLNGTLHKTLHLDKPRDLLVAWDFGNHEKRTYLYSDVKRKRQQAFTVKEAATLLGRHRDRLWTWIRWGKIDPPQQAYTLDDRRKPTVNYYSEDDVVNIHDFMLTVHRGRPRKDGRITLGRMPNRAEIAGMVKARRVLYIKKDDGEFVPVWYEDV